MSSCTPALADQRTSRWGIESVRRLCNLVEGECDALAFALGADGVAHRGGARTVAEFRLEIGAAVDALAWDGRVEPIGTPEDVELDVRAHRHRAADPPLADEAPGTHCVGDDIDLHG